MYRHHPGMLADRYQAAPPGWPHAGCFAPQPGAVAGSSHALDEDLPPTPPGSATSVMTGRVQMRELLHRARTSDVCLLASKAALQYQAWRQLHSKTGKHDVATEKLAAQCLYA